MSLTKTEQEQILSEFPNVKLSYEKMIHKKVYQCDFMLAIPKGQKCFVWFTEYEDKATCFLLELGENKQIKNIQSIRITFDTELVYNTLFYGTMFYESKTRLFSIEDIFYYKGQDISQNTWLNKFSIIGKMLKTDGLVSPFLYFGLPILSNDYNDLIVKTKEVRYRIDTIQYRLSNKANYYLFIPFHKACVMDNNETTVNKKTMNEKPLTKTPTMSFTIENKTLPFASKREKEIVFKIRPDIQNDIYNLYCLSDENEETFFDIALIPNYISSVMMNRLFRNIKENGNLDALEESDDEEEFQDEKDDRFVYLERSYNMVCLFNHKFKKWYPVKIANENSKIIQEKMLKNQNQNQNQTQIQKRLI